MNTQQDTAWFPVTIEEAARYAPFAAAENTRAIDYAFGVLYLWDHAFSQSVSYFGDRALVRIGNAEHPEFMMPVGRGTFLLALAAAEKEARAANVPLTLRFVTEAGLAAITAECGDRFDVREERDSEDYLYDATALATLGGKKLHAKRNHVNAFTATHAYDVSPLTEADFGVCRKILEAWDTDHAGNSVNAEHEAILRAFGAFRELSLSGLLLSADGAPVAFTVGEKISSDTFCVHFEKALPEWESAYPVINREFVRAVTAADASIRYINREDDLGLPNLRAAKLAYHPIALVKKYTLTAQNSLFPL